jgi:hypothetical protein
MKPFNVKMTPAARDYILSQYTEDELVEELEKNNGDPVRLGRDVINKFFRELRRKGNDCDLIVIAKTPEGEPYYRMQ